MSVAQAGNLTAGLGAVARRVVGLVGDRVLRLIAYVGEIATLGAQTVRHILRGEVTRREAFEEMAFVGVGGLSLVAVTVCFSGLVFGVYSVDQFRKFGASDVLGVVIAMTMCREVAPVLAATVVAARSGSAIAAEVATMKITEQLDALRSLATSPIEFLAVPRYIALVLMMPLLTIIADLTGVWGGGLIAYLQGMSWRQYFNPIIERLPFDHVLSGLVKAMVFGALIAISSLRQGFRCGYGSEAVGRTTTQAVVYNILWIHFANLLLAIALTE